MISPSTRTIGIIFPLTIPLGPHGMPVSKEYCSHFTNEMRMLREVINRVRVSEKAGLQHSLPRQTEGLLLMKTFSKCQTSMPSASPLENTCRRALVPMLMCAEDFADL